MTGVCSGWVEMTRSPRCTYGAASFDTSRTSLFSGFGAVAVQKMPTTASATQPRRPARTNPAAQSTRIGPSTTAKYRVAHAGLASDAIQATRIVDALLH